MVGWWQCARLAIAARAEDIAPYTANYDVMHGRVGEQLKTQNSRCSFRVVKSHTVVYGYIARL